MTDYIERLEIELFVLQDKYDRKPTRALANKIAYYTALLLDAEREER